MRHRQRRPDFFPGTLIATVAGGGVSYQWYDGTGAPIAGATGSTLTVTHYGTYTVKVSTPCGCRAEANILFEPPCADFISTIGYPTPITGAITSLPFNANNAYYVVGPLTIASSLSFTNCNVLMAKGSSIFVDNAVTLTIDSSHLATCPDSAIMWQGISLSSDWGYVHLLHSALIEDADKAISTVNVTSYTGPPAPNPPLINSEGAIFNRNKVAIDIDNDPSYVSYNFTNTIFTARDLYPDSTFNVWPSTYTLKQKTPPSGYPSLLPPYRIDYDPTYTPLPCKDGNPALTGIYLNKAGSSALAGTPVYSFANVVIGDYSLESNRNIFDQLRCGVEAYNSSLIVRNCTFSEMYRVGAGTAAWGSMGIFGWTNPAWTYKTKLDVTTGGSIGRNEFYENFAGIQGFNFYLANVIQAYMNTANSTLDLSLLPGRYGIVLRSVDYLQLQATDNIINNYTNPIYLSTDAGAGLKGYVYAENNLLSNTVPTIAIYSGQNIGILVDDLGVGISGGAPYVAKVEGNFINGLFGGISLENFHTRKAYINNNGPVTLQNSPGNYQYGIYTGSCDNCELNYNDVLSSTYMNDREKAYYLNSNTALNLGCNKAHDIGRGFEFANAQAATFWHQSDMYNNFRCFVLGGDIGPQGTPSVSNGNHFGSAPTLLSLQTYTLGNTIDPWNSRLYVLNTAAEKPTINDNSTFSPPNSYPNSPAIPTGHGPGSSIITVSSSLWGGSCSSSPVTPVYRRMTLKQVAQDSVCYGSNRSLKAWIGQMAMYRNLLADTTLTDSSAVLRAFKAAATGSRFDWITKIEDAISTGQDSLAGTLLASPVSAAGTVSGVCGIKVLDSAGGDSIVAHYAMFYRMYLAYRDSTFGAVDTAQLTWLAGLCPQLNGAVVYQARALLRIVTGNTPVYSEDCSDEGGGGESPSGGYSGGGEGRIAKAAAVQRYTLLPNPNDGNMQPIQAIEDKQPVSIKVYSAIGQLVHSTTASFESMATSLSLNGLVSGAYYLLLHDYTGKPYTLQFVKK